METDMKVFRDTAYATEGRKHECARCHAARVVQLLSACVVLALLLAACQSTDNGAQRVKVAGPLAFEVAGRGVSVNEVQQRIASEIGTGVQQLLAQGQTRAQITDLAKKQNVLPQIFDRMIQDELMAYEARRQGSGVDAKVIETVLASQSSQEQGNSPTQLLDRRIALGRQLSGLNVIASHVTADQFKTRHILVENEAEANDIVQQLKQGASFATLAREKSQDTGSAAKGGELGWVARGNFVAEYEQAVFNEQNPLNTPIVVHSQFGYHVIEIEDRQLKHPFANFQELQGNQNFEQLITDQFTPWYAQYRKDAEANGTLKVMIDPTALELPFPAATP